MSNPSIQNGLRLFVAAAVLTATTITTPGVVHSHSGGQRPHDHGLGQRSLGQWHWRHTSGTPAADHSCGAGAPPKVVAADHHDRHAVAAADDLHRHVLVFLGSAMSLPGSDQRSGGQEGSPSGRELLFSLPYRNLMSGPTGGSSDLQWWLTSEVDQCVDRNVVEQEVPPANVAPVPFLCDRARHERSGVQLA